MRYAQTLTSVALALSMLSSVTPASAMELHFDQGANVHARTPFIRLMVRENAKFDEHAHKEEDDDHSGSTLRMHNNIHVSGTGAVKAWTKVKANVERSINRSISMWQKISNRICVAVNSNQASVTTCMQQAKLDLQTKIQAWINAAFGS